MRTRRLWIVTLALVLCAGVVFGGTTWLVPKNQAYSTLASGISNVATSMTVASGEGARFPSTYPFRLVLNNIEIVQCTNRSTDTFTIVRAQESTTAVAHSAGVSVRLNITAGYVSQIQTAVSTLEAVNTEATLEAWLTDVDNLFTNNDTTMQSTNGSFTWDLLGASANKTLTVTNSSGSYYADLSVERDITAGDDVTATDVLYGNSAQIAGGVGSGGVTINGTTGISTADNVIALGYGNFGNYLQAGKGVFLAPQSFASFAFPSAGGWLVFGAINELGPGAIISMVDESLTPVGPMKLTSTGLTSDGNVTISPQAVATSTLTMQAENSDEDATDIAKWTASFTDDTAGTEDGLLTLQTIENGVLVDSMSVTSALVTAPVDMSIGTTGANDGRISFGSDSDVYIHNETADTQLDVVAAGGLSLSAATPRLDLGIWASIISAEGTSATEGVLTSRCLDSGVMTDWLSLVKSGSYDRDISTRCNNIKLGVGGGTGETCEIWKDGYWMAKLDAASGGKCWTFPDSIEIGSTGYHGTLSLFGKEEPGPDYRGGELVINNEVHESTPTANWTIEADGDLKVWQDSDNSVSFNTDNGLTAHAELRSDDADANGEVVYRQGATATEGYTLCVLEETVTFAGGTKFKALTNTIPANSRIKAVQANIATTCVAGGTTVTISVGLNATDPDKYGTINAGDSLSQNAKLDFLNPDAILSAAEQIDVCGCITGGSALGDTNIAAAGAVRVRVYYETLDSLDNV